MQRKIKASLSFLKKDILNLEDYGKGHIKGLTDHPLLFPTPEEPIATLQSAQDVLETSIAEAKNGGHLEIAQLENALKVWKPLFRKSTMYVSTVADGDTTIIGKGGCESTSGTVNVVPVPAEAFIKKLDVSVGLGEVKVTCKLVPQTKAYLYIVKLNNDPVKFSANGQLDIAGTPGIVTIKTETTSKTILSGLESSKPYFLVVIAFNASGLGKQSNSTKFTTQ